MAPASGQRRVQHHHDDESHHDRAGRAGAVAVSVRFRHHVVANDEQHGARGKRQPPRQQRRADVDDRGAGHGRHRFDQAGRGPQQHGKRPAIAGRAQRQRHHQAFRDVLQRDAGRQAVRLQHFNAAVSDADGQAFRQVVDRHRADEHPGALDAVGPRRIHAGHDAVHAQQPVQLQHQRGAQQNAAAADGAGGHRAGAGLPRRGDGRLHQ